MSFFAEAIQRGNRAGQPAATAVIIGTVYYVTDENVTERSNGTTWDDISDVSAATPHDLLDGTQNQDTLAAAVSRGSVIYGNATPKWAELVVGSAGKVLTSDGTDVSWQTPSGGGGGGLTFIELLSITANAQDAAFAATLAGDTDGVYLVQCEFVNGGGATVIYSLEPNSLATNQTSIIHYNDGTTAASNAYNLLFLNTLVSGDQGSAQLTFHSRKVFNSVARKRYTEGLFATTFTNQAGGRIHGRWNETSVNVTSLRIHSDIANGIGNGSQFKLYKYAES